MKARKLITSSILAIALTSLAGCDNPLAAILNENVMKDDSFKVVWKNFDGSILEIDENVAKGSNPEFNGKEPSKQMTDSEVFTFTGWDKEFTPVTQDATYTATFSSSPREYEISWYDYDGTLLATTNVPYGSIPEYPNVDPTRESSIECDYEFAHWDRELAPVTCSTFYQAVYNETRYDVAYIDYQFPSTKHVVENKNDTAVRYGGTIVLVDATCAGYDFNGWYKSPNYTESERVYSLPNLHQSKTIYGSFSPHTYDINYVLNDGELEQGEENIEHITCLDTFTLKNPSKTGHTFTRWKDQHGNTLTMLDDVCEDKTLTAHYDANSYTITLKFDEQKSVPVPVTYGHVVDLTNYEPVSDTYDFVAWEYYWPGNPLHGTQFVDKEVYDFECDIVLVAHMEIHEYTATLLPDGGVLESGEELNTTLKFTFETQPELPELVKEGYIFLGWFDETGKQVTSLNGVYKDITLTAHWKVKNVSISFDYNGGYLQRKVTFKDGNNLIKEEMVSPFETVGFELLEDRDNAQFNGWINVGENTRESFNANTPKELHNDIVLEASWAEVDEGVEAAKIGCEKTFVVDGFNKITYQYTPLVSQTVKFKSAGSVGVNGSLYDKATGDKLGVNYVKEGVNFVFECYLVANNTYLLEVLSDYEFGGISVITTETDVLPEDMTPKGLLKGDEYRKTSLQRNYWDIFDANYIPVKENCEFVGWFDEDDNQYICGDTVLRKESIALTAKWNSLS